MQKWRIPGYALAHFSAFEDSFGEKGAEPDQLNQPYDLTTTADDHIWVADSYNHRIKEFNPEGKFVSQFGETGSEEGQLMKPLRTVSGSGSGSAIGVLNTLGLSFAR